MEKHFEIPYLTPLSSATFCSLWFLLFELQAPADFDVGRWTLSVGRLLEFRLSTLNHQLSLHTCSSFMLGHPSI